MCIHTLIRCQGLDYIHFGMHLFFLTKDILLEKENKQAPARTFESTTHTHVCLASTLSNLIDSDSDDGQSHTFLSSIFCLLVNACPGSPSECICVPGILSASQEVVVSVILAFVRLRLEGQELP